MCPVNRIRTEVDLPLTINKIKTEFIHLRCLLNIY